jgi:chromosome segregation ATPase
LVKRLAKKEHSAALAQLASRLSAVVRYGSANGDDVFAKVKSLIGDMIAKLERESQADATEKAYCDEQMAKTQAKKEELDSDIAKLTSKIDQNAAASAALKADVKELQGQLAALAKEQAEMDQIRQESHADFVQAKADLELGLNGVRKALGVLRDYYQGTAMLQQPALPEHHGKSTGAADSIIGILEVVESDFATNLAKEESAEDSAASSYEKTTQENKIRTASMEQDVKYKTQESKSRDKTVAELSSDRGSANTELAAVMEYYGQIKARCIAKPETYEARKQRREAEIAGLKQALEILENDTAFVQRKHRGSVRGILA